MAVVVKPFQYSNTLDATGGPKTSGWVILPFADENGRVIPIFNLTLSPVPTGSGRFEFTTDTEETVRNNPSEVTPVPWPAGDVSGIQNEGVIGFTAFRLVALTGVVKGTVRGH